MKLNRNFLVHNSGDETILVPTGRAEFSGIVRGNKTLRIILELLQEDITAEEIVLSLKARFDAPEGAVERDVEKTVSELKAIGAIDE